MLKAVIIRLMWGQIPLYITENVFLSCKW